MENLTRLFEIPYYQLDKYPQDIAFSDIETKKIKRKSSVSKNDHFRNLIRDKYI